LPRLLKGPEYGEELIDVGILIALYASIATIFEENDSSFVFSLTTSCLRSNPIQN